jgi:hypothetical protein
LASAQSTRIVAGSYAIAGCFDCKKLQQIKAKTNVTK